MTPCPFESVAKKALKEAAILREKAEAMGDGEEEKAKTLDMLAKIDDKLAKQGQADSTSGSSGPIEYTVREWHPYNGYEKPKCVDAQVWQETSQQFSVGLKRFKSTFAPELLH